MTRKKSVVVTAEEVFQGLQRLAKTFDRAKPGSTVPNAVQEEAHQCHQKLEALDQQERLTLMEMTTNESVKDGGEWVMAFLTSLVGFEQALVACWSKALPFARTGKKVSDGGKKGSKVSVKIDPAETKRMHAAYLERHPETQKEEALEKVGKQLGISPRTVRRHLEKTS